MLPYTDYGVAMGDVYVAARLSALFDHINKPSQVRIGTNYSFEDLRNSPAVVVGAFNNRWTLQMTSNLRFAFVEQDGHFKIQEQSPSGRARSWVLGPAGTDRGRLCRGHPAARLQDWPGGNRGGRLGSERDTSGRRVHFETRLSGRSLPDSTI